MVCATAPLKVIVEVLAVNTPLFVKLPAIFKPPAPVNNIVPSEAITALLPTVIVLVEICSLTPVDVPLPTVNLPATVKLVVEDNTLVGLLLPA